MMEDFFILNVEVIWSPTFLHTFESIFDIFLEV